MILAKYVSAFGENLDILANYFFGLSDQRKS
jgi:hypothetical protein